MKKTIATLLSVAAIIPAVLADMGQMMGYGMIGSAGTFGMSLLGVLYFVLMAFVFSAIFWGTHNWLVKKKK